MSNNLQEDQIGLLNKCPREIGLVDVHGTTVTIDIGKNETPVMITVAPASMSQQELDILRRKQLKARKVA